MLGRLVSATRRWALAVALLLVATTPGLAAGSTNQARGQAAAPAPSAGETHTVTLLTGDAVTFTELPDGRHTYTVDAAERPDGQPVSFTGTGSGEDFFVVPSDAAPYLASGALDRALFNVARLASSGTDEELPLILSYEGEPAAASVARATAALPGAQGERTLASIDAAAVRVDRAQAQRFWESIDVDGAGAASSRLAFRRSIDKVWLDRPVHATLDVSVPQIGAPAAWAAGFDGTGIDIAVLDTGIDATHPDLAGKIVATANFSDSADVVDRHGHGTHVASIAAGTGAASGGRFRGVAPGANIMAGKVFDDSGRGPSSAVIAGMEWAVANGAEVVNMSLSSDFPDDGTDPLSQAVNRLTEESGVLMVAAAGNRFNDLTVYSPGSADGSLTVGAVDDSDRLANFSSGGPRLTDAAVKPNLTAPGVGIVAARAAGTSIGLPVGEHYTSLNGTSMATPHVAGAAAILAQARPGWRAPELRRALASTAVGGGHRWFEEGAGRVDVARALEQGVYATDQVSFGHFEFPQTGPSVTRQVTYTNTTGTDVTLDVAADVRDWAGQPATEGAFTLGASSVTVPAGGQASVDLTVDPTVGPTGIYGGVVTASAGKAVQVRTPVSWRKDKQTSQVTVRVTDSRGRPRPFFAVTAINLDYPDPNDPSVRQYTFLNGRNGVLNAELPAGTYYLSTNFLEIDPDVHRFSVLFDPEVRLPGDTEVTLDARDAAPLRPETPEGVDQAPPTFGITRGAPNGRMPNQFWAVSPGRIDVYASPSEPVTVGWFSFYDQWALTSRLLDEARVRPGRLRLHPEYDAFFAAPRLALRETFAVVDAGEGGPGDFDGAAGKLALVRIPIPDGAGDPDIYAFNKANEIAASAAAAGAAGILVYVDVPGALPLLNLRSEATLQLAISRAEGLELAERVARGGARLSLRGRSAPERVYILRYEHPDGIRAGHHHEARGRELVRIDAHFHSDKPGLVDSVTWPAFSERHPSAFTFSRELRVPDRFEQLVNPSADWYWWRQVFQYKELSQGFRTLTFSQDRFLPGQRPLVEHWFRSPVKVGSLDATGFPQRMFCSGCRNGDLFVPPQYELGSGPNHYNFLGRTPGTVRFFREGEEVARDPSRSYHAFPMSPEEAGYRLELETTQVAQPDVRTLATRVSTAWEFRSARPADGQMPLDQYLCRTNRSSPCAFEPLVLLDYDLPLDLLNSARAGWPFLFEVTAGSHPATPDRAEVRSLKVWTSTDDGATWHRALAFPRGDGRFLVLTWHPRLEDTSGFVSLRVEAGDRDGNHVTQTIERAYALR